LLLILDFNENSDFKIDRRLTDLRYKLELELTLSDIDPSGSEIQWTGGYGCNCGSNMADHCPVYGPTVWATGYMSVAPAYEQVYGLTLVI
jgi:hypothetical protein